MFGENTVTKEELAQMLDRTNLWFGTNTNYTELAKEAGFVVVHGMCNTPIFLEGAIDDMIDLGEYSNFFYVHRDGVIQNFQHLFALETDEDTFESYFDNKKRAIMINAILDEQGFELILETSIPHCSFDFFCMKAADETCFVCKGIIFSIDDLPK